MAIERLTSEVCKIDDLISEHGENTTLAQVKRKMLGKRRFKCPKCNGTGYTYETYNAYPRGLPDSGWGYEEGIRSHVCDLCDGVGYTEREYAPKTETKVVGYEPKE